MAILPAVTAGVSLIGGIAQMSAKNKAARAQREQLSAQAYQQAQQQASSESILASQQQLAQTQYQQGMLAQLAQFQQSDFGLQSQKVLQSFKTQQDAYAIQSGELTGALDLGAQSEQLQRQATQVSLGADQQRGASDAAVSSLAEQGAAELANVAAQLTGEQRKQLSLESSGRRSTGSSDTSNKRQTMERISQALSIGLDMDRTQVARAMQAFNEQDLANIGERLGLLDNASSVEAVSTNLKMLRANSELQLNNVGVNDRMTQNALDFSRQNNLVNSTLNAQGATDAYKAQDYSLGVQRTTGVNTAASVADSNAAAMRQIKGASLIDFLNVGVNTLGAASPLLNALPKRAAAPVKYSGFPTVNSNVG